MLNVKNKSRAKGGTGKIIITKIMMMNIGAPKVFTLSPDKPALIEFNENAVVATLRPNKLLTVQLWKTLGFLKERIEGEIHPYCGLTIKMGADPHEAEKWLTIAASRGDKESATLVKQASKAKLANQQQCLQILVF